MASDVIVEDVPRFVRRYGDQSFEGSNNTLIVLGTDRARQGPAGLDDGLGKDGKGTGTIHLVAGRKQADPDLSLDSSYLYLSMKTRADTNLSIAGIEKKNDEKPSAILKSDVVRIVGRNDIKICVNDDTKHYIFIDGKKIVIKIGSNTIEMDDSLVKINSPRVHLTGGCEKPWDVIFQKIITAIQTHDHLTAVGPSSPGSAGPAGAVVVNALTIDKETWKSAATE